jgi:fumarylacetoacetase
MELVGLGGGAVSAAAACPAGGTGYLPPLVRALCDDAAVFPPALAPLREAVAARRAGTVVVSGTPITRPNRPRKAAADPAPSFGPSQRLDIEAELGFVVGAGSSAGQPIDVASFPGHVFGAVLVNDWSARDIQAWEYLPLGPHLGKSFATSISPWVVPVAALEAARVPTPEQDPEPLPYLRQSAPWGLDVKLAVEWNGTEVSRPPYRHMYWSPAQMLAHMTVNGASTRTGDLFASGTISGPAHTECGSFIELTWGGSEPIMLNGQERSFLLDGDEVIITAEGPGHRRRTHRVRRGPWCDWPARVTKDRPARHTSR